MNNTYMQMCLYFWKTSVGAYFRGCFLIPSIGVDLVKIKHVLIFTLEHFLLKSFQSYTNMKFNWTKSTNSMSSIYTFFCIKWRNNIPLYNRTHLENDDDCLLDDCPKQFVSKIMIKMFLHRNHGIANFKTTGLHCFLKLTLKQLQD